MNRLAFFTCVALTSLATPAKADVACPALQIMASVDMISLPNGRVMVPVNVAGEEQYFVLGTATPYSSLSSRIVAEHNFPRRHSDVSFVGLDGEISNTMATAPSFGIGNLKSGSTPFLVTEDRQNGLEASGKRPSGTLGADFLRAYDVELDFGAKKLNLISRHHCDQEPVYWKSQTMAKLPMVVLDNNKISFSMTLDGHDLQTVLNTGVARSMINMRIANDVFDLNNDSPGNQPAGTLGNGTQLYTHQFKSLSAEGLLIANPKLVLMPSLADRKITHMRNARTRAGVNLMSSDQQPELVLGMAELMHLHVYIDYHHQTVYLTPADTPAVAVTH